ncbi:MAG: PH domain-containing protein [Arenicellales bacterium]
MSDETRASLFPATLGTRERLSTLVVGYGVGIAIPVMLGIIFSATFHHRGILLFPLVFAAILLLCYLLHPTGFGVDKQGITIMRKLWPGRIDLDRIESAAFPASSPTGFTMGIFRVTGIYGTFGVFWNRHWGLFRVFVTNHANRVELCLDDGSHVVVSPDDPGKFVEAVRTTQARRPHLKT